MQIKVGAFATHELLKYDQSRILGLGLFSQVNLLLVPIDTSYQLVVLVREAWYIWPVPIFAIRDRDWKKLSFGLGLTIRNLTGMNETLFMGGVLGYDPWISIGYTHPWIHENLHLTMQGKISFVSRKNKSRRSIVNSENYNEDVFFSEVNFGRRFGLFHEVNILAGFQYVKVPEYFPGRTVSTSGIDRNVFAAIKYKYDSRDFNVYPNEGTFFGFVYQKQGFGESKINYHVAACGLKNYFSIKPFIVGFRNAIRSVFGSDIPNYANSFIGFDERIRGRYYDYFEGHTSIVSSVELRYLFLKDQIIEFDLPLIPKELLSYNILLDIHFFFDGGFISFNDLNWKKQKLIIGFGTGLSLVILPYKMLKLDFGLNEKLRPQVILDISSTF
jgi:outer membrane protein assembly factor BamA